MPQSIALDAKSPANAVAHRVDDPPGRHEVADALSHVGPSVIGSRIPDSSSTGIITMLMTGAMTSSLLVVSASALEAAAQARADEQGEQRCRGRRRRRTPRMPIT